MHITACHAYPSYATLNNAMARVSCLAHTINRTETEGSYNREIEYSFHDERKLIMQIWADLVDSQKPI